MTAAVDNPKATGITNTHFSLHLVTMTPGSYRLLYYNTLGYLFAVS